MNAVKMIKHGLLVFFMLLLVCKGEGQQVIQATIKKGSASNKVDLFIKPNFDNTNPAIYLFQLQFPIAWPDIISPVPYGLIITIDPAFATFFGNYTASVYPIASHVSTSDLYFTVSLIRTGSAPTFWISGMEYKVFTAEFTSTTPAPMSFVKVADFLNAGSNGQGNYYCQDGLMNYYRDNADSRNNFYSSAVSSVGGTAIDGFAVTTDQIVLPDEQLLFSGYKDGNRNQLKWTTNNEINNKGFEVQRSADGINYSSIGFVNSIANGGNSTSALQYTFTDNQVTGSKQYYRLRVVYLDNHIKFSKTILIEQELPVTITLDGLFPNPASSTINVRLSSPAADRVHLQLVNMSGTLVMEQAMAIQKGMNTLPLDISSLPAGSYIIKLVCNSGCTKALGRFIKH